MICYFEKGERDFVFEERPDFPKLSDEERLDVARHWQAAQAANPKGLFDGHVFSCNGVEDDGRTLTLGVNEVNYATYKWARDNGKHIPGTYAMGDGMLLYDPDRQAYVMLERAGNTAFDAGKVSIIGGVLDYIQGVTGNMMDYVQEQTLKEVEEEVNTRGYVYGVGLLGAYVDADTWKVEFCFEGKGDAMRVKAHENVGIVEVKPRKLVDYVQDNATRMEQSTLIHMQHWANKLKPRV